MEMDVHLTAKLKMVICALSILMEFQIAEYAPQTIFLQQFYLVVFAIILSAL
jgi:hypothetical protein